VSEGTEDVEGETTTDVETSAEESRPEDHVAERFLELEAELSRATESPLPEGAVRRGQVVDAGRVPVDEIPDGYPVDVGRGQALVLTIDLVGVGEVQTYLDWPEDGEPGTESTLGRLLDSLGVEPERLAALYGQQLLVEIVDGSYTVYVPAESPRGTDRATGIAASLGVSLAALLGSVVASGTLAAVLLVVFVLTTLFAVPFETYRDSWYLRTHSDWEGGPVFWAVLAMVPLLNVLSTVLYLSGRRDAMWLGK
jgi:hypothetical protein